MCERETDTETKRVNEGGRRRNYFKFVKGKALF